MLGWVVGFGVAWSLCTMVSVYCVLWFLCVVVPACLDMVCLNPVCLALQNF